MSKKLIMGIVLFVTGILGTGLFSIAQSNIILVQETLKIANKVATPSNFLNGMFLIICIIVAVFGFVFILLDTFKKEN